MRSLICLMFLSSWLSETLPAADAQWLTLPQKRENLRIRLRELGPLPPAVWTDTPALQANNLDFARTDVIMGMGNYAVIGSLGNEYLFGYNGVGQWTASWGQNAGLGLRMDHFGLHELSIQPQLQNYYFGMDPQSYNVAGLRYLSLNIVYSAGGAWHIQPGQGFHVPLQYAVWRTFDLQQQVEIPEFLLEGYWFGPYFNYPQDARLKQPQNTLRQTENALRVGAINKDRATVAWAQEGVYRPGYLLQPGFGSPRLSVYMEQYFDAAWQADPNTGDVPRTGALNWNGRGKIATASATPTGWLSPSGYLESAAGSHFRPNRFGKAILTTLPQENGHYGELPFYALGLLVDRNRDGALDTNDVTTAASPHVFWVNNDRDRALYEARNLWDELDLDPAGDISDAGFATSWSRIPTLRDLEDYDRLHVRGLKELSRDLPAGQSCTIQLRWKSVQWGNPGIFVFKSADGAGSRSYLTDAAPAAGQIAPSVYPPAGSPGPSGLAVGAVVAGPPAATALLHTDAGRATTDFFLYCGTGRGAGELAVSVYRGGQLIGEVTAFLELRDVKELYERWTVGDANGGEPATEAAPVASGGLPATQFNDPAGNGRTCILFVHGWNMAPWEKDAFAETAFKRLYWQGYTNRFASFRWPTTHGFTGAITALTDGRNYDNGEFCAWRSAEGLRRKLVQMNQTYPGKVYVVAHSMGNVVAGEALALQAEKFGGGQIVNTYVASQAAVPMHCYNSSVPPSYQLGFQRTAGIFIGNFDSFTPNVYPGWLSTNRVACAARVNFYNPHDWALAADVWQLNQILKPDYNLAGSGYGYQGFQSRTAPRIGTGGAAVPVHQIPSPARRGLTAPPFRQLPGTFWAANLFIISRRLDFEYKLQDMYEVMSYASEARSYPIGVVADSSLLDDQVNLWTVWPVDTEPDSSNGTYGRHKWHSAQFRSNYARQEGYWRNLVGRNGFNIFQDR
jgi:hypothetical protein